MPDTFTPDQFSQTQPINLKSIGRHAASRQSSASLSWAPASQAYVVMRGWPASERLILLTRGETGYRSGVCPDTANMTKKEARSLASKLNLELGVRRAAANALALDWQYGFKEPPLPPSIVAEYLRGQKAIAAARSGTFCSEAAPAGWLYAKATTNYYNVRLWPTELHFVQLAALYETIWARAHGRETPNAMLPSELAADRFNVASGALFDFRRTYNERYSCEHATTSMKMKDFASYNRVKSADQNERREALLTLRRDRRPLLQAQITARAAYVASRSEMFHSGILQSGRA
jgi:hypothetical protein